MRSSFNTRRGLIALCSLLVIVAMVLQIVPRPGLVYGQTPTTAADPVPNRSVSVAGHGEVQAAPDQATISIGVESQAASADAALDDNNAKMAALLKIMKDGGVASKDIQTSNLNISPVYGESRGDAAPPVTGYRVSNQVSTTIRNLDALGPMLDRVVKAGANQIYGISFGFADPQALLDQARDKAMADANRRAKQLATLGQARLGVALTISEGAISPPMPMPMMRMMADSAGSVPIEAGSASVSVDVQVTYALN